MSNERWVGVPDLLSRLEDLELPLLSWGVVDGYLSKEDVLRAINEQLDRDFQERPSATPLNEDEYLEHLLDTGLLHKVPDITAKYRTRLAEMLRLLRTLRQLLPTDESQLGWWRHANALVADYRLRVSPRWYPERAITAEELIADLGNLDGWTDAHADVLRRVVDSKNLARFQVRAARSILDAMSDPHPAGRIVTAGTGSGKTLAFYLPAMLDIAGRSDVARTGPHTLALYPRNELLRDQARESLRVVENVGPLNGPNSRVARIGLLYGNTPSEDNLKGTTTWRAWKRGGDGWVTPYFPCLDDDCGSHLVWTDVDRASGTERLSCPKCGATTTPGMVALTRESIRANPPDILFSSTEMLSKQSTHSHLATVLGWRGPNGTRLVLLDEVHTYSGVHGAQVALMLRRWRYANRQFGAAPAVMVGLSATLRDAGDFFATLTGVDRANVEVIGPALADLRPTSREYGVILRGDPLSGASLLSTTIQTAMLVARVLDEKPGHYGSVTFAFTDDLDVINRLHDNLRDAEGHDKFGLARGRVLADLRSPGAPHAAARYREGQSWDLPERLGWMDRPLRIARTSSQDAGVDNAADVIAATSSLEVGFNDPRVGAVIQHKAPRDVASFLQRRGRAGRYLAMRPITAVVLSDYGRDRIAYQSYERLLDPEIGARSLPVGNRFVVKMQATHALLDWILRRVKVDARWVFRPPYRGRKHNKTPQVAALLKNLLGSADLQRELATHLQASLMISPDEANAALWEEPRSILLSVVPTALRRLESTWTTLPDEVDPGAQGSEPLPEFMTNTLFDPLNTPDVQFELPFTVREDASMGIAQAMREAVPGRVSRRFGYSHASHSTWLPVPPHGAELALTEVVGKGRGLGTWTTTAGEEYLVVRPLVIKLQKPPREVASSSSAFPVWRSAFGYSDEALHEVDIPTPSIWAELIDRCAFALHVTGGPLRVQRMAIGSDGELLESHGKRWTRRAVSVRYTHNGEPAALGFELDVDALILTGRLPEGGEDFYGDFAASPVWRTLAFKRRVREDARLDGHANGFHRDWLTEVYRHAHVSYGLGGGELAGAQAALADGNWTDEIDDFFAAAYRVDEEEVAEARLLATLRELAESPLIRSVIEEHGRLLVTEDPGALTTDLLDRVLLDTLGYAVLTAVQECVPDAQDSDLTVDIEFDADGVAKSGDRSFKIIVSETAIGGLGLLEALHRDYALDPRQFWDSVGRACAPTEAEDVDLAMQRLVADLVDPASIFTPGVEAFRDAEGIDAMDTALKDLIRIWTERDGPPSHLLVSTFAARLLRPGSGPAIDRVIASLAGAWVREESRLGVEIDARTLAFQADRGRLGFDLAPLTPDMAFSMLWLRGAQARSQRLQHWHPYRQNVVVERTIFDRALNTGLVDIDVTRPFWQEQYVAVIERDGRVSLSAPYSQRVSVSDALREVAATPVERAGLRVYGRVTAMQQRNGTVRAQISLAEELQ